MLAFCRRQFLKPKPMAADTNLTNQVAIITGSNTGVGFEAARQLLGLGLSHLILAVRSQSRGDAAASELRRQFPEAEVSVWQLDMQSYDSVRAFSDLVANAPRIDMVILNAGLLNTPFTTAPETGHEVTMMVNYYATALLSTLLVPVLKAHGQRPRPGSDGPPVLSVIGSDMMWSVDKAPDLELLDDPDDFAQPKRYAESKFLIAFFVQRLATTVSPEEVLINVANPGMTTGTSFWVAQPWYMRLGMRLMGSLVARSVEVGASTYVDAVVSPGLDAHGSFISDWEIKA